MSIAEKLIKVQSELKAPKKQNNDFGHYKYRSCEDIVEAVKPILKANGLILLLEDDIVVVGDRYYIKATAKLLDSNGESIQTQAFARESLTLKGQSDSQITGTASSYARKYALNGLFAIDDSKLEMVADPDGFAEFEQVDKKKMPKTDKKSNNKPETADFGKNPAMATKEQLAGYQDLIGILNTDEKTVQGYINDKLHLKVKSPHELTVEQMDTVLRFLDARVVQKAS